ncbi:MAG TPA: transcription-repair coupling factor [Roseiflexaceae bacterium]|nr:transcription-repair coupling factor [Roseiflexaceae bacterium]
MPDLDVLLQQLADHERVEALSITLREQPRARLFAGPVITAARPALLAALATHTAGPLVYVVDSSETATRAVGDLNQWLDTNTAMLFSASDALAYERMSTSAAVLAGRLRVLQHLQGTTDDGRRTTNDEQQASSVKRQAPIIVASVRALMQPTLAPTEWNDAALRLRQGDVYNLEELIERWIAMGYRSAPTVEEPGELSRRGGIIDIFPPGDEQPLRIEFFGDEVDSLRRFDPVTQRSNTRMTETIVGPPQDLPFWRRDEVLARIRNVDTSGLRPEARDEWETDITRLEHGERFEGRGLFAPFFRENDRLPTLLDHLPPGAVLVFSDLTLLSQHAADLQRLAEDRHAALVETGELPADYPRPYVPWNELLAHQTAPAFVDLSSNEWLAAREHEQSALDTLQGFEPVVPPQFTPADLFGGQLKRLVDDVVTRLHAGEQVVMVTPQAARMQELVEEAVKTKDERRKTKDESHLQEARGDSPSFVIGPSSFVVVHGSLDQGWHAPDLRLTLYTDTEIFGWRQRRSVSERTRKRDQSTEERAAFLRGLKEGDYVVHIEHGIAQYDGLVRRTVGGIEREYLNLRYAEGDRLYVPVDQIDRVSRYIGAGDATPHLTRLGTQEWERAKRKARAAVQDLASDLLKLYAQRQLGEGHAYQPDTEWQRELEDAFPYAETDDQLRAIADVKRDMELPQPMDRLVCGDVGFGKTEVALRAAFKAVQDGKQVAVLVPTTVLAQQHYDTFSRRMAAFPIKIELLSRFRSASEQRRIIEQLGRGEIDIIVGTHRLLSKDVRFKDLGLLVVDEEQRFGVRHKERIKQLRANVDVLTLTATPIPRTLHMAMAGIRDLSVIDTPPQDRLPIRTYMLPYDERLVREAILREMDRGGQVFFVHNRVQSIHYVANKLQQLVPEARIVVGHGQMDEHQLEKVMLQFFEGEADVLVSTTIIENGLDVPNANTIIVEDATKYGLAQLYQLRGRVGRSSNRAYAYLFYPGDHRMTDDAQERLLAIQEATELGAGLRIAMRDLEIRGAGNLLGSEQSGQIAAVGFDLYTRLLAQAVEQLKGQFDAGRTNGDKETRRQGDKEIEERTDDLASKSPPLPVSRSPRVKVDERVLVAPLVTLDLPMDAYLPTDYIADEQVRLSVYQRLADVQTPQAVRDLRQELRDRFGEPPEPAACLLTWLMIKALALKAGVASIVTTDEEFIVRLPMNASREALRRRYSRDPAVKIGPQFVRLDRRELHGEWIPALTGVLDTIAGQSAAVER